MNGDDLLRNGKTDEKDKIKRVPDDVVEKMEVAYRTELAKGCPEAADDTLFFDLLPKRVPIGQFTPESIL